MSEIKMIPKYGHKTIKNTSIIFNFWSYEGAVSEPGHRYQYYEWKIEENLIFQNVTGRLDRLCGLVVRVLGYRSGGPGSIPGTTRKKK
jgi:hypothetical protein